MYNGKELDTDFGLNWYHYGARMYDPAVAIFGSIDPKAESFSFQSPYVYAANNPVLYIDKNGENPIKLLKAAYNVGKRAYKTYKKTGKLNAKSIGNAAKDELFSIVDNVSTIVDDESSFGDKAFAAFDLVTGFGGEAKSVGAGLGLFKSGGKKGGDRAGKSITKKTKSELKEENIDTNGGFKCQDCGTDLVDAQKSQRGVKPPSNEAQYDHIYPKNKGGDGSKENGQVLCRGCNRQKSDTTPDEYYNNN